MKRAQVLLLAVLSVGLTADGPPAELRPQSTLPAAPTPAQQGEQGVEEAARIGEIVLRRNPTLSPTEGARIGRAVLRSATKYGLDPDLVTAVLIVESGARPWAESPKGAVGLMQVMPYMMDGLDLAGNLTTIESNIEAGCIILADNIRRLGEDDGISAYFWGSNIRGVAYLDRVRAARAQVRRLSES